MVYSHKYLTENEIYDERLNNSGLKIVVSDSESEGSNNKSKNENSDIQTVF